MLKIINDYTKLGIRFYFKKCDDCNKLNISIMSEVHNDEETIVFNTCVSKKQINEDNFIIELSEIVKIIFEEK